MKSWTLRRTKKGTKEQSPRNAAWGGADDEEGSTPGAHATSVSAGTPPPAELHTSHGSVTKLLPRTASTGVVQPQTESSLAAKVKSLEQVVALSHVLSAELKAKTLQSQQHIQALQAVRDAQSSALRQLLDAIAPVLAAGGGAVDAGVVAALEAARAAASQTLQDAAPGAAVAIEGPTERQARLEVVASVVAQHEMLVAQLARGRTAPATMTSTAVTNKRIDMSENVPFLLAHLVLRALPPAARHALSCTSQAWQARGRAFVALRRRTDLLLELCRSERRYQHELAVLVNAHAKTIEKNSLCDSRLLVTNVAALRSGSRLLVDEMEMRLAYWSPSQLVGDVFNRLAPYFGLTLFYSQNLDAAFQLLRWLMGRPESAQLISEVAVRTGRELGALLLLPVQRIASHSHWLEEEMRATPAGHPDASELERAHTQLESLALELGTHAKVPLGQSVLGSVRGLPVAVTDLKAPVLRHGVTTVVGAGQARLFLCGSCIVLATESGSDAEESVFMEAFLFSPPPVVMSSATVANAFDLHSTAVVKTCSFDGAQGKISWMQAIKTTVDVFLEKNPTHRKQYDELRNRLHRTAPSASVSSPVSSPLMSNNRVAQRSAASLGHSAPSITQHGARKSSSGNTLTSSMRKGKTVRGLQKRGSVVDNMPAGAALYQLLRGGVVVHLDVHPASLSNDGVFVLAWGGDVLLYRAPKMASDSEEMSSAMLLAAKLTDTKKSILLVDGGDAAASDLWWSAFGAKFKINEPTPKDVLERYGGQRPSIWVIYPNKMMEERPAAELFTLLKNAALILVVDCLDDVFLYVGAEAPLPNTMLARAKAEEVLESDSALRPVCAAIKTVDSDSGKRDAVFEFLIRGQTLPKKAVVPYELNLPPAAVVPAKADSPPLSPRSATPSSPRGGAPGSPTQGSASSSGWFNTKKATPAVATTTTARVVKKDESRPLAMRYQLGVPKLEMVPPRDYDHDDPHCNREVDPMLEGKDAVLSARSPLSPRALAAAAAPLPPPPASATKPAGDEVLNMLAHAMDEPTEIEYSDDDSGASGASVEGDDKDSSAEVVLELDLPPPPSMSASSSALPRASVQAAAAAWRRSMPADAPVDVAALREEKLRERRAAAQEERDERDAAMRDPLAPRPAAQYDAVRDPPDILLDTELAAMSEDADFQERLLQQHIARNIAEQEAMVRALEEKRQRLEGMRLKNAK